MTDTAFNRPVEAAMRGFDPAVQGSKVTVALSGGADSVALCHFLAVHAARFGITVAAAHLNHGLRGAESDRDEAFVRAFCAWLGVPLVCEKLPAGSPTSEAALRQLRYDFLWRAVEDGFLATGHTLTDSCETMLFHLARGTRLAGMRGIPRQAGRLIRPLLDVTRADTEEYCRVNALAFVTDSSNLSDAYARNRLRHGALPALTSVNPCAQQAMAGWMQEAGELYAWLDAQAAQLLAAAALPGGGWCASTLAAAPDVVLRQALARTLGPYADTDARRLALAADAVRKGGAVDWCAGVRLRSAAGRVWLETEPPPLPETPEFCCVAAPGVYCPAPGIRVEIRRLNGSNASPLQAKSEDFMPGIACESENREKKRKINKKDLNNRLDCARITSMCLSGADPALQQPAEMQGNGAAQKNRPANVPLLRFRAPGDQYAPGRGRGTKSLKKWFNEIACPPKLRARLPLIAVGSNVVWLAGSGAAEGFAESEDSAEIWEILYSTTVEESS